MTALAQAARQLATLIRQGEADGGPLHHRADALFRDALRDAGIRWYACDGQDDARELSPSGDLAVALDPLEGDGDGAASRCTTFDTNIDTNTVVGTIFSVFAAADTAGASFLRPARDQLAAGYVIYGPACCLVVTFGAGTRMYRLNPDSGVFEPVRDRVVLDGCSAEFAINAANYRHWPSPVRAYIDDCLAGVDGPREQNFNMRWTASLVAETHRILMRGGIYLYPPDSRKGCEKGRLRMVHQCAPIAFVVEQAGGRATNGSESILAGRAGSLQERTPFVFGSGDKVDRVAAYHDLPEPEVSALFGNRGLFRA
ncbi:fructose-1,6-bisphosphatase [Paracoccus sp. DMF-8]|uniref:fructose-1,6-bisphosphatase n=1 Tax=Paracoccus sp. DMF-8 TaxID=3019445 RepID=UPI0023E86155|nr:fructose-1,6-bisphosphatase [Paracoccus sp. DMF-8]MDF3606977.1 fructose-1,6-bisphosphatase [Paracoccus sp. DMF-8]